MSSISPAASILSDLSPYPISHKIKMHINFNDRRVFEVKI